MRLCTWIGIVTLSAVGVARAGAPDGYQCGPGTIVKDHGCSCPTGYRDARDDENNAICLASHVAPPSSSKPHLVELGGPRPSPRPRTPTTHSSHTAQWQAAVRAAEQLELDAKNTGSSSKFVDCGNAYLAIYNQDPDDAGNDEVLYNAAACFEEGKSLAASVTMLDTLRKFYPSSRLAAHALARLGNLYGDLALYDRASEALEEYAKTYGGERDAYDALSDAVFFRKGLGDDAKAIADTKYLVDTFGRKRPQEAANAMFSLTDLYEAEGNGDRVIANLRAYIARFGALGGSDRLVIAYAKIGLALWHESCPVKEIDGACVQVVRERALASKVAPRRKGELPTQCGPASRAKVKVIARDPAKVKAAMSALGDAIREYEAASGKTGGDEVSAGNFYAQAKMTEADKDFEAYAALNLPSGLDFDPQNKPVNEDSLRRFGAWSKQKTRLAGDAVSRYEAVVALKDTATSIAAAARIGQIEEAFSDELLAAPIPRDVRTGDLAEDKVDAFCDQMVEVAEPLQKKAIAAFDTCLATATKLAWTSDWSTLCERELGQLAPESHMTVSELHAEPDAIDHIVDVEPPATGVASIATELESFAANERAGWSESGCRTSAAQFAKAVVAHPDLVEAQYMVGLSFQRCNLATEAEQAYQQANKMSSNGHAASMSNLGALYFRAGRLNDARQQWDGALRLNGKLVAARINLAAMELDEMRRLASSDPTWSKLEADAQFQLSNALAIDQDSYTAYTLLGLIYLEGSKRNRDRLGLAKLVLDEAKKRDESYAPLQNAYGLYFVRRGDLSAALAHFSSAAAADARAAAPHLNAGLVLVSIRAFDKARTELSVAALASVYDAQIALGIALRGLGDADGAEAAYQKAMGIDATRGDAYFDLGVLDKEVRAKRETDLARGREWLRRARDRFTTYLTKSSDKLSASEAKEQVAECDKDIESIDKFSNAKP